MKPELTKPTNSQVRLILPENWVAELDAIAKANFISRLALIRRYLRLNLDEDLKNIREHLMLAQENRHTVDKLSAYQERMSVKD